MVEQGRAQQSLLILRESQDYQLSRRVWQACPRLTSVVAESKPNLSSRTLLVEAVLARLAGRPSLRRHRGLVCLLKLSRLLYARLSC